MDINEIYKLRRDFIIIGLTGRTGSGCTTIAEMLSEPNLERLRPNHQSFREGKIDNQARKDRIVSNFIKENWEPFVKLTASDFIYYFALKEDFDEFIDCIALNKSDKAKNDQSPEPKTSDVLHKFLDEIKDDFTSKASSVLNFENSYEKGSFSSIDDITNFVNELTEFRASVEGKVREYDKSLVPSMLQEWGNNIRKYGSIKKQEKEVNLPSVIAEKIDQVIDVIRKFNLKENKSTNIVIDALRNPFEILYFRERYASFYCMSVNTTQKVRHSKLLEEKNFRIEEIKDLDEKEKEKKEFQDTYQMIDIDKCIELSDIHLSHDGTKPYENRSLINQLLTYVSLILHPGLIPPTPQERLMQIAYTAKLNSGCLSRQVGAVVTDSNFSVKSIGWNSTPEGQVPCSLRQLDDLFRNEDNEAYSNYELHNENFIKHTNKLKTAYTGDLRNNLNGIGLTYCFKNIHTEITEKQKYNQVHTRSLHAEENAFLQIAKYGGQSIAGGKLFTTASCCELCAKKAYHLGIKEIYYIDAYPGISQQHILDCGDVNHRPKVVLFSGAVGRAFVSLYNPFLPLKDEIEVRTGIKVSDPLNERNDKSNKKY